ncbi:serologically defined colon cancer antigen 8 homolog [Saccoglossus kowalevskii]|uniref:Serologically defined colon cancer antigen 8 homolog n=1 Tax=Saccoglossus kowalevskii TaxID=10224 RepID=A0ABM0GRK9_SACKO|nr:PREDICTED: serologically defined colon cancer antigen 8 homolog [Saccoglossus kowalevskii]
MDSLEVLTEYQKHVRERANASLKELKSSLSSPTTTIPSDRQSTSPSPRLHLSHDYDNAVDRLRHLLKDQDGKSGQSPRSKMSFPIYEHEPNFRGPTHILPITGTGTLPSPSELLPLINNYISYIYQLEGKNRFIEEELKIFKMKMEEFVDENSRLHEQLKAKVVEETLQHDSVEDLERAEQLVDSLKSKMRMSESQYLLTKDEHSVSVKGLCFKCAQNEAVIASTHVDMNVKAVDRLTIERDDLMDTVTRMKKVLEDMKRREDDSHEHVRKSIEMVEQAQLEKTQALVEKAQLDEELNKQREHFEGLLAEHQVSLEKEKEFVKQQCNRQIESMQEQLQTMLQRLTAMDNQVDKVTREKTTMMSELEQARSQIMHHADEINKENIRVRSELRDIRRRLQTAEKQAAKATEVNVRTAEKLAASERLADTLKMTLENLNTTKTDELWNVTNKAQQREEELINLIEEMESKHTFSESELERMVGSQNSLISKLKAECQALTNQLQNSSEKFRNEKHQLKEQVKYLSGKVDRLDRQHKEMEAQCVDHSRVHNVMTNKLKDMDKHSHSTSQQVFELLNKVNSVTREKEMLKKEIMFLQQQLETQSRQKLDMNYMVEVIEGQKRG